MQHKTLFIDAPLFKSKGVFGITIEEVNGDQLNRDVAAAIREKELEGYELLQALPVQSAKIYSGSYPYSYTSGILLIFKQVKS